MQGQENLITRYNRVWQSEKLEKAGKAESFILGFEESYGYLAGSYVRDKDAVVAVMLIAEMASYYKERGKTLAERMEELYAEYGTYAHKLLTFEYAGASGAKKMQELLKELRQEQPKEIAGLKVERYVDYLSQTQWEQPKANVMQYDLEGGAQAIVRPSGTEPQIKVYLTAAKTPAENARELMELESAMKKLLSAE